MEFHILDTESVYRRLLAASDASTREAIFRTELIEPFQGLVNLMGGGDGLAAFAQWGMKPEQFTGASGAALESHLDILSSANAWTRAARALETGWAAFADYAARIPTERIVFGLMLVDMSAVPGQRGYSGFGALPGYIMTTYGVPDDYNLVRVEGATVHELHHNILNAVFPRNFMFETTVADYMVMEGLAESFAAELYGEDKIGHYVTEFDESRLEETIANFKGALDKTGFNTLRAYIFGDSMASYSGFQPVGVPPFAGYALGYRVVQAYLKRTGVHVADATFVPTAEIIAGSGVFG
jgi:uncharacterized protein YjaZ